MITRCIIFTFLLISVQGTAYYTLLNNTELQLVCTYNDICTKEDIIITVESDFLILITVKDIGIDGENGDFLLIKSGSQIDDGLSGRRFTHYIDLERKYLSLTSDVFIRFHVNERNHGTTDYTGYILTAQRFDKLLGSEIPTDSTNILTGTPTPTPPEDISDYITVNMTILGDVNEAIPIFQEIVATMAYAFTEERFNLSESISPADVIIRRVIKCPINWANWRTCFQITFALPIFLSEYSESFGTYQLTADNLRKMWTNSSYFFNEKDSPSIITHDSLNRRTFIVWISVISGITVIFGISYLIIGHICSRHFMRRKVFAAKRMEDRPSVIIEAKNTDTFEPHPLQNVPPLFQNDMTFYEPDNCNHRIPQVDRSNSVDERIVDRNNFQYFDIKRNNEAQDAFKQF